MKKIILLFIIGCSSTRQPTPEVKDTPMCVEAEEHLTNMCKDNNYCCQVVALTKKGKTFTQVCIEKQNQGIFFNPRCLAGIKSCGDIDNCGVK